MNALLQNGLTTTHTIFKEGKFSLEYNGYIIHGVVQTPLNSLLAFEIFRLAR